MVGYHVLTLFLIILCGSLWVPSLFSHLTKKQFKIELMTFFWEFLNCHCYFRFIFAILICQQNMKPNNFINIGLNLKKVVSSIEAEIVHDLAVPYFFIFAK